MRGGVGFGKIQLLNLTGYKLHALQQVAQVNRVLIIFLVVAEGGNPDGTAVELLVPGRRVKRSVRPGGIFIFSASFGLRLLRSCAKLVLVPGYNSFAK